MFTKQLKNIAIAAGVLFTGATAQAASLENTFGLAVPHSTITFDEIVLPYQSAVTNQYAGLGLTISPNLYYDSQSYPMSFPGIAGHYLGNNGGDLINPFSLLFGGDISAVAFGIATNPGRAQFEALNDGVVVETFLAGTSYDGSTNSYFGFTGITFDEVRVTMGGDGQMLIDNVQFAAAAVPEPETYAMMLAGLSLLGFVARRRKQQAA